MAFQRGNQNMATSTETMVEDTFISEMLAEFGKFNSDFFLMKIMSKAIDTIGTDPQKFIMLTDLTEDCLTQCGRLDKDFKIQRDKILEDYINSEGMQPQSPEKKLEWKLGLAVKVFALIFGKQTKNQPVEITGKIDPPSYIKIAEQKHAEDIQKQRDYIAKNKEDANKEDIDKDPEDEFNL